MDFVDLDESVAEFDGLLDLEGAPGPAQRALLGRVTVAARFLQEGFCHFFFHARLAEGKGEFTLVSVGQDGMVKFIGW